MIACWLIADSVLLECRLFDDCGEGFISVARFREILREIDDEIAEEELDGIISDVRSGDF